jgi:hypothetical protein
VYYVHQHQLSGNWFEVREWRPGFEPRSGHLGFVVDKVTVGQIFFRVLRFPLPIFIPPTAPHSLSLSYGPGTIGQIIADAPSGLSLTSPKEIKLQFTCDLGQNIFWNHALASKATLGKYAEILKHNMENQRSSLSRFRPKLETKILIFRQWHVSLGDRVGHAQDPKFVLLSGLRLNYCSGNVTAFLSERYPARISARLSLIFIESSLEMWMLGQCPPQNPYPLTSHDHLLISFDGT